MGPARAWKESAGDLRARLPGAPTASHPEGLPFVNALMHGSMSVELFCPRGEDRQVPHERDELYVVVGGTAVFERAGMRLPCAGGDVLFVPARMEHRFHDMSDDFTTWVVFWGRIGGEADDSGEIRVGDVDAALIAGQVGSGKTSVAIAIGEILDARGIAHAVIDLDWLCWVGPGISGPRLRALLADNLRSVASRCGAEGVERLVLSRAIADVAEVDTITEALGGRAPQVVVLDVPVATARRRVMDRAIGSVRDSDLAQLSHGLPELEGARIVQNHDRDVQATAQEILEHLGWLR